MGYKYLVDTNILIYHLNGIQLASEFIDEHFDEIEISQITYIEVLSFPFKTLEEEEIVRNFLNKFKILNLSMEISEKTIELRKRKKVKLPDAIICGTASVHNLELVTHNEKDFKNTGIIVLDPLK